MVVGDSPSEITGESIKQYSRQTPVFFGGEMLESIRVDSWGSIPHLRMPSLLPHDLCPEWNASPAPGTRSVPAQPRDQWRHSHVISASQSRDHRMINTWSVHAQSRYQCMISIHTYPICIMVLIFLHPELIIFFFLSLAFYCVWSDFSLEIWFAFPNG